MEGAQNTFFKNTSERTAFSDKYIFFEFLLIFQEHKNRFKVFPVLTRQVPHVFLRANCAIKKLDRKILSLLQKRSNI